MDPLLQPAATGTKQEGFRVALEQIEIHQLDLRYAHTRVISAECLRALCASLERFGQISPLVSVSRGSLVLIDGYRRVAALKRNRKDTALVEIWPCSEHEALLRLLAKPRRWEAVEEAALLRELLNGSKLSRAHLARLLGKDPSWVSRRLDLLESLSDELLGLIGSGRLSSWAASRVIVPLARANEDHALRLASHILKEGISSRDLVSWFHHYQKSNHTTREKMVESPGLFLRAVRARVEQGQANRLREGPEGRWLSDLSTIIKILRQRRKETALLCGADLCEIRQRLHTIETLLRALIEQIERIPPHDEPRDQRNDSHVAPKTHSHPHDQQAP